MKNLASRPKEAVGSTHVGESHSLLVRPMTAVGLHRSNRPDTRIDDPLAREITIMDVH